MLLHWQLTEILSTTLANSNSWTDLKLLIMPAQGGHGSLRRVGEHGRVTSSKSTRSWSPRSLKAFYLCSGLSTGVAVASFCDLEVTRFVASWLPGSGACAISNRRGSDRTDQPPSPQRKWSSHSCHALVLGQECLTAYRMLSNYSAKKINLRLRLALKLERKNYASVSAAT